jgi:hypothetical protein
MSKFVLTLKAVALMAAPSIGMAQNSPPNLSVSSFGNQALVAQP